MVRYISAALILAAAPALAEPATEAGADRIEAAFVRLLGPAAGAVAVAAEGETYRLTLDLAAGLELIPGVSAEAAPTDYVLTDLGGGRWQVAGGGPWTLSVRYGEEFSQSVSMQESEFSGIFDEALLTFSEYSGWAGGFATEQRIALPDQPPQQSSDRAERVTFSGTATAGSGGGVDGTGVAEYLGYRQTSMQQVAGQPLEIEVAIARGTSDARFAGVRLREAVELLAWLAAHPSAAAITADEAGLKAALRALLPVFGSLDASVTMTEVAVTTPVGAFAAQAVEVEVGANGLGTDGRFRERVAVSGLTVPEGLLPPWAAALVPAQAQIDFGISGFDAGAAARLALDELGFGAEPPEGFDQRLQAALMPQGTLTVTVGPTGAEAADYALDLQGTLTAGPLAPPVGKGFVSLRGIDAILAALGQAPEEVRSGAVPGLLMARGISRAEGDTVIWDLEATPDGQVLINGGDISGLLGR